MPTIAIVGAGPGVGAAVARRFGREGYAAALISRNQDKLDAMATELAGEGIQAQGFSADVRDAEALKSALAAASAKLGAIEVLQYSPLPAREYLRPVLETTPEQYISALKFSVMGPVTAVPAVLPDMRGLGRGTILFVNGGTSVQSRACFGGTSVAFAGESAYAEMLHEALADEGIYVSQLVIPGGIQPDDPIRQPAAIAERLWGIHAGREGFRHFLTAMEDAIE